MKTDILTNGSTVKKTHLIINGIRIQCNTENFVPIVIPGLSTSSSSSFPSATSMTPSRQEIDHPTSSSSSSTSPTTTASSDMEIQDREDQSGIGSSPVPVSSSNVEEMIERRNPLFAADSSMRSQANPNPKTNKEGNHERTGKPVVCRLRSSAVEF